MDRDRVNEVLYNRPYDSLYNRCFGWLGLWAEWKHVLEYGADALRCTDGQILNGIRNRMVYWLSELALSEYTMDDVREEAQMNGIDLDDMMMELPPVMDENYMKDAESIMEKGTRALQLYEMSQDYHYVVDQMQMLIDPEDQLKRLKAETAFVWRLKYALRDKNLVLVKQFLDVDARMTQLQRSRALIEMRMMHKSPFEHE